MRRAPPRTPRTGTPFPYTTLFRSNDLVRFIDTVIGRSTIVSGLSSGGVISAWLSAYAKPGQVIAACYEDPPIFSSELRPATGQGIRQCIGPMFDLWSTYLGDQWSIGAWDAMRAAAPDQLPHWMQAFPIRSEEHTSELQSLMRISYAVFCLKTKIHNNHYTPHITL